MRLLPIALGYQARVESSQLLNHIAADSIILHDVYKKHHWLVRGVITKVREAIRTAANRDDGTNDLLMTDVLRTNELQVWFIAEHLVDVPAVGV